MLQRLTLVALAFALAAPAVSYANPEKYEKFLTQLEGEWGGMGSSDRGGSYSLQLYVGRQGETKNWVMHVQKSSGFGSRAQIDYSIAGNFLVINDDSIFGGNPFVTYASETELRYTISKSDFGDMYDYNYEFRVSGDGLQGRLSVQRNMFTIYNESWSSVRSR